MRSQQPPRAAKILRSSCLISTTTPLALVFQIAVKYKTYMAELAARCCGVPPYRVNRSAANMMKSMSPGRPVPKLRLVLGLRTEPGSAEMYQLQEL